MKHLTSIKDIEQTIADNRLCLFYIKVRADCIAVDGRQGSISWLTVH